MQRMWHCSILPTGRTKINGRRKTPEEKKGAGLKNLLKAFQHLSWGKSMKKT